MILQEVTEYLRKELKVPQYSYMFDNEEEFNAETKALFDESPVLEGKLVKLKSILEVVL